LTLLVAAAMVRFPPTSIAREMLDASSMPQFVKWWVLMLGILLWTLASGLPGKLRQTRDNDAQPALTFDPARSIRGEFFAFFLFSLTGVMLCASANDLAWLFLALELTSLPTYVMVATTRDNTHAQESGVKYFFLGAMSAAIFLYGFTLIYGATGTMNFHEIQQAAASMDPAQQPMFYLGIILSIIGISFKIAAFPMHFYAADVYQGAATPVTAFLGFVPKTAGFVSLILILRLVGGPLPEPILAMLWVMAAATMTIGNVLALLQNNVKRALAYSSIAHSGYMLVGLAAGPWLLSSVTGGSADSLLGQTVPGTAMGNGVAGVLFYLVAYGLANFAAFAVLGCLERQGDEAQTYDDLSGLYQRDAKLALVMLLAMLSLLGIPPLVGFMGKVYLLEAAISTSSHAMVVLVVIAVINTAISAVYYMRIASVCFLGQPREPVQICSDLLRTVGAIVAAVAAITYGVLAQPLVTGASRASEHLSIRVVKNDVPSQNALAQKTSLPEHSPVLRETKSIQQ
jgi:NADH-quinone oxidoreductase subunit N